jgi:hypothetical protein
MVSSKHSQLEKQDNLLHRVAEAAQYVPYEQLAPSPQCGFASVAEGNLFSLDAPRRKVALVVETAWKVGGSATTLSPGSPWPEQLALGASLAIAARLDGLPHGKGMS